MLKDGKKKLKQRKIKTTQTHKIIFKTQNPWNPGFGFNQEEA
jgi:hypothetical protein